MNLMLKMVPYPPVRGERSYALMAKHYLVPGKIARRQSMKPIDTVEEMNGAKVLWTVIWKNGRLLGGQGWARLSLKTP